ncbi:hypothetical protein BKA61DRAFT_664496 [Leptodontidium sp. MPI-SDFR-AT-0119]|nr:hypothetical protein BKA61DRAFT_664496 [Leptodontidium sp. MPI-SDFR-AT-0119]
MANKNPSHHATSSSAYNDWSPINEEATEHLWGYGVQYQKYRSRTDRDIMGHIDRPKLLLVDTKWTHGDRKRLRPRLKYLIERGIIRKYGDLNAIEPADVMDVLIDYFVKIFGHSKQQLVEREGYTPECPVTFALTVPSVLSAHSPRMLQAAVQVAIRATEFVSLGGESFSVLDCGGGTVDGSTFTVTNTYPFRLYREEIIVAQATSMMLLKKRLLKRLEDEHYLDYSGETREDIVRYATLEFENRDKRPVDIARRPVGEVKIPGLRGDDQRRLSGLELKNFKPGYVPLNK